MPPGSWSAHRDQPVYRPYAMPPGRSWTLTATAAATGTTGYTLTNILTGALRTFDGQGCLLAAQDAYGNSNTLSSSGRTPLTVTNSGGRRLVLAYQNGRLSDVRSPLW